MPTVHVTPDSQSQLQDIANSLFKARKVVVVTGAGISTNSGIPDFRSENGLYSLIQAQFDAASRQATSTASGETQVAESDSTSASASRADEQRPAKRRRISMKDAYTRNDAAPSEEIVVRGSQQKLEAEERGGEGETITVQTGNPGEEKHSEHNNGGKENDPLPYRVERPSNTSIVSPPRSDYTAQRPDNFQHAPNPPGDSRLEPIDREGDSIVVGTCENVAAFPTIHAVPGGGNNGRRWPANPTALKDKRRFRRSSPLLTPNTTRFLSDSEQGSACPAASSPLSSPPVNLFDPYQTSSRQSSGSSSTSENESSMSSRSSSEDPSPASTPPPASQSSFLSHSNRNSLPAMKGKDLFDAQIWADPVKTSVFYTFATTLRQKVREVKPTSSHHFVSLLRDCRKLVRCYTQNIDQLEERVGLSTSLNLGPGTRYRFSTRAGRPSAAAGRNSLKEAKQDGGNNSQGDSEQSQQPSELSRNNEDESLSARPENTLVPQSQELQESSDQIASSLGEPQATPVCADGRSSGKDEAGMNVKAPAPDQQAASTSESASTSTSAPAAAPVDASQSQLAAPAPNRGVECVFLHGSLDLLRCFVCARTSSWDEADRETDTMAGRQPACPHCAGATAKREERGKRALGVGKLRPDIVLYGEEHPHAHLISPIVQHDLSLGPDMLLILGTSLRVHGLKVLVKEFARAVHRKGGRVVFVNFTKPPESVWADVIDFWVQWDCDAWVGDLRERKPALWLPPGTSIPGDDDEPKATKTGPRESSGSGESGKRKSMHRKSAAAATATATASELKVEESSEATKATVAAAPAQKKKRKSLPAKEAKEAKERKLNPNAKRPVAVRDHKLNGAHLVWKIMQELHRITEGGLGSSAAPTPSRPVKAAKPRVKRARKSAPALLESTNDVKQDEAEEVATSNLKSKQPLEPTNPVPSAPAMIRTDSSISAAVKGRNRKRTAWKMIRGIEVQVPVDADGNVLVTDESPLFPPRPTQRRSGPVQAARPGPSRRLPDPTTTGRYSLNAPLPSPQPAVPLAPEIRENGFHETDRLIAKVYDHARMDNAFYEELASRPSTPVQLAPLRVQSRKAAAEAAVTGSSGLAKPKLQPLEPKLPSPGPNPATLSPNVCANTPHSSSPASSPSSWLVNPFFLMDPLARRLEYPAAWHRSTWSVPSAPLIHPHPEELGSASDWAGGGGHEEQLRDEHAAAVALTGFGREQM